MTHKEYDDYFLVILNYIPSSIDVFNRIALEINRNIPINQRKRVIIRYPGPQTFGRNVPLQFGERTVSLTTINTLL